MRFFDQKEEVLNIELTSYGKEKFSKGEFQPVFYAFYDNNILYDGAYANITEKQNQITNRIANETPRLKINPKYTSEPGSIFSLASSNLSNIFSQENTFNSSYYRVLGQSDPNSVYYPSWKILVPSYGEAGLNEGVKYVAGEMIPQMSATLHIDYESDLDFEDEDVYRLERAESLILSVEEINTIFKNNGNFDIEVYVSSSDEIRSIQFINDDVEGSGFIRTQEDPLSLLDTINGTDRQIESRFPILDETFVEYFLDITVDDNLGNSGMSVGSMSSLYQDSAVTINPSICEEATTEE